MDVPSFVAGWIPDSPWLATPLLLVVSAFLGLLAGRIVTGSLRNASALAGGGLDDTLLYALFRPLSLGISAFAMHVLVPWFGLPDGVVTPLAELGRWAGVVAAAWAAIGVTDLATRWVTDLAHASERPELERFAPLAGRALRVVLPLAVALFAASMLGYPVGSVLAGLGLGGLALALAAQKTAENVFGAIAVTADAPFKVGDYVRIDGVEGEVESVGLRSTRLRTLDRTQLIFPNAHVADLRIENFSARDAFRLHTVLGVQYGATAAQVEALVNDLRGALSQHPTVAAPAPRVAFRAFGASSLDVEVQVWFHATDYVDFAAQRQALLLVMMREVEAHGLGFAFPTRTVHVTGGPAAAAG